MSSHDTNQQGQQNTQDRKPTVANASTADRPTPINTAENRPGKEQNAAQEAKQAGQKLAQDAKDTVNEAAREVRHQANDLRHQAQDQAEGFLTEQKDAAARRVGGVADALRHTGQELADRNEDTLAHYTESIAGQIDHFSNSLREREIGGLVDDAKALAHRQPELFVAGALAAGFVLGRFFKSSRRQSERGYADRDYGYDRGYAGGYYGQGQDAYGYSRFGESYETDYGRDYEGAYRQSAASGNPQRPHYGEYDPRNPARPYGEPYGQRYGETLSQSRGPAIDQGSNPTRSQGGQQMSNQSQTHKQAHNQAQTHDEGHEREKSKEQNAQWSSGSAPRDEEGQVTTHGLGTGQSIQHQEDLEHGQEFGKGEEQVSNYKGNETKTGSEASRENEKDEGKKGKS